MLIGENFKKQVTAALPTHLKPDRFIRVALTALTRTPKLAQCTQASFFKCLLDLSALGIEPDGRRAHLIPYENRKLGVTECTLIVDWKGKVELVMRSGVVSNFHADIVCENDEFEYDRGELKKHKIDFKKDRGEMYAAYALCRFKDGSEKCEVMSKKEVDGIRARSKAAASGPWVSDYNEMAKKTLVHRICKGLPLSPEHREAIEVDDETLDDKRFAAARPVYATVADVPLPLVSDADPAPDPEGADGGLGPVTTAEGAATTTVTTAPAAAGTVAVTAEVKPETKTEKKADAKEVKAAATTTTTTTEGNPLTELRAKFAANGIDEKKVSQWMCAKFKLSPCDTLDDLNDIAPGRIKGVNKEFDKMKDEIQAATV